MATLKEIQNCELEILKAVAKVCDDNNINYYISSGTMLGAVRHKGFIPWDDDIDILIFEKDKKKFKKACIEQLDSKFFVQDYKTDKGTPYIMLKVRNKNTYMPETNGTTTNQGIWIDVFPVVKTGRNDERFAKQVYFFSKYQYYLSNQMNISKTKYKSFFSMVYRIVREIFVFRPLTEYYYHKIMKYSDGDSKTYIPFDTFFFGEYSDEMVKWASSKRLDSELFESRSKYEFEDDKFYSFSDYDKYLKTLYGDNYMIPKQYSHFSDYSNVVVDQQINN